MRCFLFSSLLVALPLAAAAGPADEVVEARRGYFALIGTEFGPLAAMAKGEAPYDFASAKAHAADLAALASYSQDDLLMPGTSRSDVPGKTRAEPAMFEDAAGYQAKSLAFLEAVTALNEVADKGAEALAPAVGKLGGTCKGCHEDYRSMDF